MIELEIAKANQADAAENLYDAWSDGQISTNRLRALLRDCGRIHGGHIALAKLRLQPAVTEVGNG